MIFHIDVNSAFLSWSAVYNLKNGKKIDLRTVPSVIGGDSAKRHGIVVAKSIPAKKFNIKTGDTISMALQKCPNIIIEPPIHKIYNEYSKKFIAFVKHYFDIVEQASIDECYVDVPYISKEEAKKIAIFIKDKIKHELYFSVNVGISDKKVLAKMASDMEKPDKVHTLFSDEIKEKMWPLPIERLYMSGKKSSSYLRNMGINTIGALALSDESIIESHLKSHGKLLYKYANGIDTDKLIIKKEDPKGIGNSKTAPVDITSFADASIFLKELSITVSNRLKKDKVKGKTVLVEVKFSNFIKTTHQAMLDKHIFDANDIFDEAKKLLKYIMEHNKGMNIRLIGVRVLDLSNENEKVPYQMSIFDIKPESKKDKELKKTMKHINDKYGLGTIHKGI